MKGVKFPIGLKLIVVISCLLIFSLGAATTAVTWYVSDETRRTAEENNYTINSRSASSATNQITMLRLNVLLLLDMMNSSGSSSTLSRQISSLFFERNQNIAAVVLGNSDGAVDMTLVNNRFFVSNELDTSFVQAFLDEKNEYISRSAIGETCVLNASPVFGQVVLAMFFPYYEGGYSQCAVVFFSGEDLLTAFASGSVNESFMINHDGDVLVHSDYSLVMAGVNAANSPLVIQMRENADESRQVMFSEEDGTDFFGAYNNLGIADLSVLTTVPASVVFEPVYTTLRRNAYLTVAVLFISTMLVYFFSLTISRPVQALAEASDEIEKGHYILKLKAKTRDEIGLLTERFVRMGKGLDEREKLKDTFGRFINKEIAEKAMRGELALGGETKRVTVFFSDIRSFTAISEKLQPYEVVEFLNDYMTRMVECVNMTGGVVDKFIGDAVMAVWGAPVSSGSPAQDAYNCVKTALMMRSALLEFNKGRGGDKKPVIKIGCGINSGDVVAGQIGSESRMEYTVIGDAVNLASRTESLNKPLGTDILITENTYNLIKEHVLVEEMPSVHVKGKEEPIRMFGVVNIPKLTGVSGAGSEGPKSIREVRALLGIPEPDLLKVNVNEEEKKYKL